MNTTGVPVDFSSRRSARLVAQLLVLREWREGDLPTMVELFDDPCIALRTPLPSPFTLADAEARLVAAEAPDRLLWAVTTDGDRPVGEVLLTATGELGYLIGGRHRRQGLAVRALTLLRDHAHHDIGMSVLRLKIESDNDASVAVARKSGFQLVRAAADVVENKGRRCILDEWEHVQCGPIDS